MEKDFIEYSLLSIALFESLLAKYPMAASHYCSFLRQNSSWNELKSIYQYVCIALPWYLLLCVCVCVYVCV